ncbi:sulfite exporter TauE/SafE family protein [Corallincola platygyrae]|uniref:Probable membrane transporter protein n=1 Tax=Corallincola platygyrae TaxID=1193278 RepID=A0ABW4XJI1_9GAMM
MISFTFILSLTVAGLVAGLLAGLFGVGGGIVLVPIMYFLFLAFEVPAGVALDVATATSLACIIPTSLSSILSHHRRDNIDWSLVVRWCLPMITGVAAGASVIIYLPGNQLTILFAAIAIFAAFCMLYKPEKSLADTLPNNRTQALIATSIGAISTMVGIGGGSLSVPTLSAYNYETRRAIGTAASFGLVISLPSVIALMGVVSPPPGAPAGSFGLVNIYAWLAIVPFSVTMAPLGAHLASKLDPLLLKRLFAVMLAVTSIRMALQGLGL